MRTRVFLGLILVAALAGHLNGCSAERGKSFSPTWTGFTGSLIPELEDHSIALSSDRPSLMAGELALLTVKVTNPEGRPGFGSVQMTSNPAGGFNPIGDPTQTASFPLDHKGTVQMYFTAGNVPGTTTIRAILGVASSTLSMPVTHPDLIPYTFAITSDRPSLKAGEKALLTVRITDPQGGPASGTVRMLSSPAGDFNPIGDQTPTDSYVLNLDGEVSMRFTAPNLLGTATIRVLFGVGSSTLSLPVTSQYPYLVTLEPDGATVASETPVPLFVRIRDQAGLPVGTAQTVTLTSTLGGFSDSGAWPQALSIQVTDLSTVNYKATRTGQETITARTPNAETATLSLTITD